MKNTKKYLLIILLISVVILSIKPIHTVLSSNREASNIGDYVNPGPVVIQARGSDGQWSSNITDEEGKYIYPENYKLEMGQELKYKIKWSIDNILQKNLIEGDWFEFDLPSNYFKFSQSSPLELKAKNSATGADEIIGTFEVLDANASNTAKARIVLNKTAVEKNYIKDGVIEVAGNAIKEKKPGEQMLVGKTILPNLEIISINPNKEFKNVKNIDSDGLKIANNNLASWEVFINYDDVKKAYSGEKITEEVKQNMIFTDELPIGHSYSDKSDIQLSAPIYSATKDGKMSSNSIDKANNIIDINSFTKINQLENETWTDYQNRVKGSSTLAYGIYFDKNDNRNKIIFNFKDFPGSLRSKLNKSEITSIIDQDTNLLPEQKLHTKNAYEKIFSITDSGVLGIKVNVNNLTVSGGSELYKNEVKAEWIGGSIKNENILYYQKPEAQAVTGNSGNLVIKKLEKENDKAISGASFKLQKEDNNGNWIDFVPLDGESIKTTNDNGEITFGKLSNGKYKVVETTSPEGYSDSISFKDGLDTFQVLGNEYESINIIAYNEPIKSKPVEIFGSKKVTGKEIKDEEFTFILKDKDGKEIAKTKNNSEGKFNFKLEDLKEGSYEYILSEQSEDKEGMTYDKSTYKIEIVATKDQSEVEYFDSEGQKIDKIEFENEYKPVSTSTKVEGTKKITGKNLENEEFTFILKDKEGKEVAKTKNNSSGNFSFKLDDLKNGEYKYSLSELNGNKSGMTYDKSVYDVKVLVEDGKSNVQYFDSEGQKIDKIEFKNEYKPVSTSIKLEGTKKITGKNLENEEFIFILKDKEGKEVAKTKNNSSGNFSFKLDDLKNGEYKYSLSELNGNKSGMTYDKSVYDVKVLVEDGKSNVQYFDSKGEKTDKIEFKNEYKSTAISSLKLEGTKKLTGKDIKSGEFTFILKDNKGKEISKAKNDSKGKFAFELKDFKDGVYEYSLSESNDKKAGITYDNSVYKAKITITNGKSKVEYLDSKGKSISKVEFKNEYKSDDSKLPKTGIENMTIFIVIGIILIGLGVVLFIKKK